MNGVVSKRYAKAFLAIAIEDKREEKVGQDLKRMANIFQQNKALQVVVLNPGFKQEDRFEIIKAIGNKIGLSVTVMQFCRFLISKNRLFYLPAIAKAYQYFADLHANRLRAVVISARQLDDKTISGLKEDIRSQFKREVEIDTQIDPGLIGGVITKIRGTVIDGSIKNYLNQVVKEIV